MATTTQHPGNPKGAAEVPRRTSAAESERIEVLKEEGNTLFRSGQYKRAIESFTQALKIDNRNHIIYSNRSAAYCSAKMLDLALQDALTCIALDPSWPKGYLRKGAALYAQGQFDEAAQAYFKGYEENSTNTDFISKVTVIDADKKQFEQYRYEATAKLQQGRFSEALPWFDKALVKVPNDHSLKSDRNACHGCIQINRPDNSVLLYGKVLSLSRLKLKPKWISVQGTGFAYYPEDDQTKPKFNLSLVGARVSDVQGKEFCVNGPTTWPRIFRLKAESAEDCKMWASALVGAIAVANSKVNIVPTTDMNSVWSSWGPQSKQDKLAPSRFHGIGLA